jgi:hypothetical protein
MTVADAWPLQQAVYSAVAAAVASEGIPVLDHTPTNPPDEFVRLDGMNIDDASFKDTERGRHSVIIGFFARPVDAATSTRGQARVHEILGLIHAAVKDLTYGRGRMNFEYKSVDSGEDGITTSGMLRYTIHV